MYADLDRPPLDAAALRRALVYDGSPWSAVDVVAETGSTNADLAARARDGATDGTVLVAEHQAAGRGRLDRDWTSPPQAGLTVSVLLRPLVPPGRRAWLPLLTGVALVGVVREVAGTGAWLKWPNDLLVGRDRAKAAGILAEVVDDAVIVGIGLNVSTRADELPPGAASLDTAGAAVTDRDTLLRSLLRSLADRYVAWSAAEGDAVGCGLLSAYVEVCDTLGRAVTVTLPAGAPITGVAEGIDSTGRLQVRAADGALHPVAAGDVTHVRPAG